MAWWRTSSRPCRAFAGCSCARNSSFTYKGRAVDVKKVGRELGVRYVLEGSVRKAAHKVRITGQLIDATTGAHLWAERFESALDDIFELQDQVTEAVVGAIAPQLERAEIERAKRKPTESLDAYDFYLRGMAHLHLGSRESIGAALGQFNHALIRDPNFASAYAMAAWCYFWRKVNGWITDLPGEIAEAGAFGQICRRTATPPHNFAHERSKTARLILATPPSATHPRRSRGHPAGGSGANP
jgi:hypothetical protein